MRKTINWGGKQAARVLAGLLAVGAFIIYWASLHRGFFPGESVRWAAISLHAETMPSLKMMLFRTLGVGVAGLPFGPLPLRLNLLGAVCGALAVALLFALVRALVLVCCFRSSPVPFRRRKFAAIMAGLGAALALGSSVPFWIAATRLLPQTFEVLLVLLMGWLLLTAAISCRQLPLLLFGMLLGASVLESDTGMRLTPLFALLVIRATRMGQLNNARGLAALAVGIAIGVLVYLLLAWHAGRAGWAPQGSFVTPLSGLVSTAKIQYHLVVRGWRSDPRMLAVVCFAIVPLLAAAALSLWRIDDSGRAAGWVLNLMLAGTTAVALVGITISPWGAYRPISERELPCMVYAFVALVAGYLTGIGFLQAGGRLLPPRQPRRRRADVEDESFPDASAGRMLGWAVLVLVTVMGYLNTAEVRAWREPLAHRVAAEVVKRLDGRSWIIAEDSINTMIRVVARQAGKRVRISYDRPDSINDAALAKALTVLDSDPAFRGVDLRPLRQTLATNVHLFVQTWIATDPRIGEKLLVMRRTNLWEAGGLTSLPDVVGFRGVRDAATTDLPELVKQHEAFWNDIERLPPLRPGTPAWIRMRRAVIRHDVSEVGLQLAAFAAARGQTGDAERLMDRARRLRDEPLPVRDVDLPL